MQAKSQDAQQQPLSLNYHRFAARQPIFDRSREVVGYELLFRNGVDDFFNAPIEQAARTMLDNSLVVGLDTLCNGRRAFVNCTSAVLLKDLVGLLPANETTVEVLESVEPDERIIVALQRLKKAGYCIALDDFAHQDARTPLVEYADILKIDVRATTPDQRADLVKRFSEHCRLLAEKVESQAEYREAYDLGFYYFQGYFFQKPELVTMQVIPANRLILLRLLAIVSRTELELDELEKVFKQDASICYRLLRYLNSASFGFRSEIRSIRHALSMLGEREVRRWVRLIVTLTASSEHSAELVIFALARARFCELLAQELNLREDLFLLGLLSLMDALLEMPMDKILEQLPIDHETKAVLLSQPSRLRPLYQLVLAQESGEWEQCGELTRKLGLNDEKVGESWWQSLEWAQEISKNSGQANAAAGT